MTDTRPQNCCFRLQDEGKPYPRSSCEACRKTITTGLGRSCSYTGEPAEPGGPPPEHFADALAYTFIGIDMAKPTTPADVKDAARRAVSDVLRDSRTGFAIKACMIGGAYEAFTQAIEAAIMAERERCAVRAEEWKSALQKGEIIDGAIHRLANDIRSGT